MHLDPLLFIPIIGSRSQLQQNSESIILNFILLIFADKSILDNFSHPWTAVTASKTKAEMLHITRLSILTENC